ncbi:peptidoglycan-binding protein [Virgibacillus sp. NKC19-16]|uniref:peptidoglycan-binding protein n=1 Tax=Virgibacillus salidurans TaxID=2831673 RepID=UPI001F46B422|nr:peptidoglycan-binding protein [Virgibacillus sp. NKC19-16]UJL45900.1 peptidoglycan-binding protein [Virgibacillus sp. NKC19-16]
MKIKHLMILFVLLFSLFHFSPLVSEATESGEDEETSAQEGEDGEQLTDPEVEEEPAGEGNDVPSKSSDTEESEEISTNQSNESPEEKEQVEENNAGNSGDEEKSESDEGVQEGGIGIQNDDSEPTIPYEQGDNGQVILEIKEDLVDLGFTDWSSPSSEFDSEMEGIVSSFQAYYGLDVDGLIGEGTLAKIDEVLSSQYQYGNSSEEIQEMKEDLVILGYADHWTNPTTYYGNDTEDVVRNFQSSNGLVVNGIIDEVTLAKIEELMSEQSPQLGDSSDEIQQIKEDLVELGFANWTTPSRYFGSETEEAVLQFQAYYSLTENGVMDDATLAKINEVLSSHFQYGNSSQDIQEMKEDLVALGYAGHWTNPTTYYGSETTAVVRDFQSSNGLAVNGIVDEVTSAKIEALIDEPLEFGMRRPAVTDFKEDLVELGFADWTNPTNYFGSETEEAVLEFQAYYSLTEDGIMGEKSLAKIDEVLASHYQYGNRSSEIQEMKIDLVALGFADHWTNPTTYYGPETEEVVRDFQSSNGLAVSGIADEVTLAKMEELLDGVEPPQVGDRSEEIRQIKEDLVELGFADWANPTTYFGSETEEAVLYFQSYYGLTENGIMDEPTLTKIEEILSTPFQHGNSSEEILAMKEDLVELGYADWKNPTQYYGSETEEAVQFFQRENELPVSGIADEITLETIEDSFNTRTIDYTQSDLTLNEALTIQMGINAKPQTDSEYDTYVSKEYIDDNGDVIPATLNVRGGPGENYWVVGELSEGEAVTIIGELDDWYQIEYTEHHQWVNASPQDVLSYLDPNNNDVFQHLKLSSTVGVTASELNNVLIGEGILEGTGQAFIDGGDIYSVNEIYLISHAIHETGGGTSPLSNGSIDVGKLDDNTWVSFKPGQTDIAEYNDGQWTVEEDVDIDRSEVSDIQTTYNMFGIGAVDINTDTRGSVRAYQEEWLTPEAAIIGGAQYIGEDYIHNADNQNTLYKMRWNPVNPGSHQYATDVGWAIKQVTEIQNMYSLLDNPVLQFDITQYQ